MAERRTTPFDPPAHTQILGPHPGAFEELPQILAEVAAQSQDMIRDFSERHAIDPEWQETAELPASTRGEAGFGSTGKS